ncbi:radical SAM family heme chaperone HemW [Candidatus Sneabacter namystus]|uniref:Heme chaperone HemW n=1 Tax=Candidatus Sneabacter namystus TaxID=2601646 RepID=A0A5C0UIW3_9RICK|nr:radical SAM family heme chaperone HemW [Candidatus Sneabacter namystus]QEK39690.1 radical SAM family heme chaperone HemW [Candidatus Sneabacter namystus]
MLSVYIHWPFCLSKCPYCDFNSHVASSFNYSSWQESYKKELRWFANLLKGQYIRSIFFGGGTPSLMSAKLVEAVINEIAKIGIVDQKTEISLEANPTSVEAKKFKDLSLCGINRISIGVQSLRNERLGFLGRQHTVDEALYAVNVAKKEFKNCSMDIIYACKGQSISDWKHELEEIIHLQLNHLSLYQLTIEENTKFHTLFKKGKLPVINSDYSLHMYNITNDILSKHGYIQYEISNYASKLDKICKHNMTYWRYKSYLGIGPGAHSRIVNDINDIVTIEMHSSPKIWMSNVDSNNHGIVKQQNLTVQEILTEKIFMGLRITEGIDLKDILAISGQTKQETSLYHVTENLIKLGHIKIQDEKITLTKTGFALHTEIASEIISSLTSSSDVLQ